MAGHRIIHYSHGELAHDVAISIGERICVQRGYKLLDGSVLKDKHYYPGDPDIYFEMTEKISHSNGSKTSRKVKYVIEVQQNMCNATQAMKIKQFEESMTLHRCLIVPLNSRKDDSIWAIEDMMKDWIP